VVRQAIHHDSNTAGSTRRSTPRHTSTSTAADAVRLDAVIHERVRLAIISALAVNESLSFNDLKKLLEVSDGNLSVHARTEYKLSASGRRALESYLQQMESVIRATRSS